MSVLQILSIAIGGAIGAVLRAAIAVCIPAGFPWGTFVANVVGSFIIGIIFGLEATRLELNPHLRVLLTTGFCGALTTFSTFSYQTLALFEQGQVLSAFANIALNLCVTLAAVWTGLRISQAAFG